MTTRSQIPGQDIGGTTADGNAAAVTGHAAPSAAHAGRPRDHRHARVALVAGGVAVSMLGAAYAAVPLYKLICEATGMGGTTQRASQAPGAVGERRIAVRFDATVSSGLPWDFRPAERSVEVRLGEANLVHYTALNRSVHPNTGTATFNVTPEIAGKYFSKIECFCFTQQELGGGQKVEMPVTFFIDPAIEQDPDARAVKEITLSYTFFASATPRGGLAQKSEPAATRGEGATKAVR